MKPKSSEGKGIKETRTHKLCKKHYKYSRKEISKMLKEINIDDLSFMVLELATKESKPKKEVELWNGKKMKLHKRSPKYHIEIVVSDKYGVPIRNWLSDEELKSTPPQPKKIEKIEKIEEYEIICKEDTMVIHLLWEKQCEIIDRLNSLTNK